MKVLPLPKSFDENEWFFLVLLILSIILYKIVPKRFSASTTILLLLLPITVSRLLDKFLSAPDKDWYDVFDSPAFEFFDLVAYTMYAPFGYFYIYLYDYWKLKGIKLVLYILGWGLFAIGFEWLSHQFHLYKYKDFTFTLGFGFYIPSLILTILFYHLILFLRTKHKLS